MKNIIVRFCFIVFGIPVFTQAQPSFNRVYPYFYFRNFTGLALCDSGYVLSGIAVDSVNFKANIEIDLINYSGDLISTLEIKRDSFDCHLWNKSLQVSSDSIFFTGYEFKPGESYTILYAANFADTLKTVLLNLPAPD